MSRDAEVPQQQPSEDVAFPEERGALYDLPKVSSNDLVGEVIDILGYYGPFKSSFTSESGKEKHYVVFRFRPHGTVRFVGTDGMKGQVKCGEEAQSTASAFRVIERIQKIGKLTPEGPSDELAKPLRALFAEEKTQQGWKVRTLKAPPSDWACESCSAKGKPEAAS